MRCIIIEDEPLALKVMTTYVKKVPFLELQAGFRNPLQAVQYLQEQSVDLVFIDINMPALNGLQLLQSLTQPPMIIFTTAYAEYAVDSYEFSAVDYLLKPIEFDRFLRAVNKAHQRFQEDAVKHSRPQNREPDLLFIKSGHKTYRLKVNDILYIEAENNYVKYVTPERSILSLDSLSQLEQQLPATHFIRVHKSFIIAIRHVDILQKEFITIQDQRIPVGRVYREAFFARIDKIGRQGN